MVEVKGSAFEVQLIIGPKKSYVHKIVPSTWRPDWWVTMPLKEKYLLLKKIECINVWKFFVLEKKKIIICILFFISCLSTFSYTGGPQP